VGEITTLFTQYSVEELILFIIIILFVIRALNELFSYFYSKLKTYFGVTSDKEQ
jgi:hypothetical protein